MTREQEIQDLTKLIEKVKWLNYEAVIQNKAVIDQPIYLSESVAIAILDAGYRKVEMNEDRN